MELRRKERAQITEDFEAWAYFYDDGSVWFQKEEIRNVLLCSPDARVVRVGSELDQVTKHWNKQGDGELELVAGDDVVRLINLIFVEDATASDLVISMGQEMMQ